MAIAETTDATFASLLGLPVLFANYSVCHETPGGPFR